MLVCRTNVSVVYVFNLSGIVMCVLINSGMQITNSGNTALNMRFTGITTGSVIYQS